MRAVNSTDTEGDLFRNPRMLWENRQPPAMGLVHGPDAATPDTPLAAAGSEPDLCAQNLSPGDGWWHGRRWKDETNVPRAVALYARGASMRPFRC